VIDVALQEMEAAWSILVGATTYTKWKGSGNKALGDALESYWATGFWSRATVPTGFGGALFGFAEAKWELKRSSSPSSSVSSSPSQSGSQSLSQSPSASSSRSGSSSASRSASPSSSASPSAAPTTGGRQWGFSLSPPLGNWANLTSAVSLRQLQEAKALGMTCPRISGHIFAAQQCRDLGFKQWIVILAAGKNFADPTYTINYARAWPEAIIEPGNELNIGGSPWTPEALADAHIAWYKAVKASDVKNLLSMASVGNSYSTQGNLTPLEFNKRVAARGCVLGTGFDLGSYHSYGASIDAYDAWMHIYTPDGSGASLQSIFKNPPYYITEFNLHTADANAKAAAIKNYMDKMKTLPNCLGGHIYTILNTTDAGTNWGLVTDSYVKIQPPWDTFHAEATGVALEPTAEMKEAARLDQLVKFTPDHETGRLRPSYPAVAPAVR
jgi:hypothetical protein